MDISSDKTLELGLPSPATDKGASAIPSSASQPSAPTQSSGVASSASDESAGVVDQEWVNRAKAIVDKTKHDPFSESKELSKIKASYLKNRYNKDIKVSEDHS